FRKLFNLCLRLGVTPTRWNVSIICPVPKKPEAEVIQDFRPISLTNMARRIFEGALLRRMTDKDDPWGLGLKNIIPKYQTGFQPHLSIFANIMVLNEALKRRYNMASFIDVKAAYDSVEIP